MTGDAPNDGPLAELRRLRQARVEIERAEEAAVRRARVEGSSWHAIAMMLGVSRQAAHKKYGRM